MKYSNLPFLSLLLVSSLREACAFSLFQQGDHNGNLNRRDSVKTIVTTLALPTATTLLNPSRSNAIDLELLDTEAKKFRKAPAFAIVDSKTGVPFMILRNTGLASAYFFTTYEAAQLVLNDAKRDAQGRDAEITNAWDDAKISAVTLEFALKLSKGKPKATAQNGQKYETVSDIIPTIKALEDAGKIDKSGLYTEQGRVPLFYSNDFKIAPAVEGGEKRIPVFFDKGDLLSEWGKKHPDSSAPSIKVVDLIDTFSAMVSGQTTSTIDPSVVKNLYLVSSQESKRKAVECEKSRGEIPAYKVGEMTAVGGK